MYYYFNDNFKKDSIYNPFNDSSFSDKSEGKLICIANLYVDTHEFYKSSDLDLDILITAYHVGIIDYKDIDNLYNVLTRVKNPNGILETRYINNIYRRYSKNILTLLTNILEGAYTLFYSIEDFVDYYFSWKKGNSLNNFFKEYIDKDDVIKAYLGFQILENEFKNMDKYNILKYYINTKMYTKNYHENFILIHNIWDFENREKGLYNE